MEILGGIHQRRKLFVPKEGTVRPTIARLKRSLFDILREEIEGKEVLDLFAGVGGLGLEALSRGASHVTFVENNPLSLSALSRNIKSLKEERRTSLFSFDVFAALSRLTQRHASFDIIFADPPYGQGFGRRILAYLDHHQLLREGGSLFLEERFSKEEELDFPLVSLSLSSERSIGKVSLYHFLKI